ncbi:GATA zinc finger domain-containing protein 14-like [Chenopodium quinoa]|uniref:GATA zinc finger domain-containing protein 14-like n=1 Tax=Chenopodium quinoa TaxID=63459 RepID=UPI000B7872EC|nr:GATA zinc finger domain-containing protein 14-like [Chenopodium quinoa]
MDWQDGERESPSNGSAVYSIDHLNAINNLTSQVSNLGKEMSSIKAKLESASSQAPTLPSQFKGKGTSSKPTPPSSSNNMPSGFLFCDVCGSYDHDASNCPHSFSDVCDDFNGNENEHVNYVSNNNGSRFDNQRGQVNRNYHNHGNFDNYNQGGGYRNQGFRGYGNQNQGYGNQNQAKGNWNNQGRGNFQNNSQRGPPPGFVPKTQVQNDNFYVPPSSYRSNLEEIIDNQTKLLNTYMEVSDKKFNEMMTHNKMLENQIS